MSTEPRNLPKPGLKVEHQQTGGPELLTPAELAALELPEPVALLAARQEQLEAERTHLFAHVAGALDSDRAIAREHVEALHESIVTVHHKQYKLGRILGRGGFGLAWLAKEVGTEKEVVLKLSRPYDHKLVTQPDNATDEQKKAGHAARSAMMEISSLHRLTRDKDGKPVKRNGGEPPFPILQHAQLLYQPSKRKQAKDMRIAGEVLEYIAGPNLEQVIRKEGNFQERLPALKKITLVLVSAVRRMHAAGVLHLDLKPSNVVINEDGNPIILDFGGSQIPDKWTGTSSGKDIIWAKPLLTTTSPGYTTETDKRLPPAPARDVYALGMTLRNMIIGYGTPPDLNFSPELEVLSDVIADMIDPDPDQRPSMADIEEQLMGGWQALEDIAAEMTVRKQIAG